MDQASQGMRPDGHPGCEAGVEEPYVPAVYEGKEIRVKAGS